MAEDRPAWLPSAALAMAAILALALIAGAGMLWHHYGIVLFMEMLTAAIWSCF